MAQIFHKKAAILKIVLVIILQTTTNNNNNATPGQDPSCARVASSWSARARGL